MSVRPIYGDSIGENFERVKIKLHDSLLRTFFGGLGYFHPDYLRLDLEWYQEADTHWIDFSRPAYHVNIYLDVQNLFMGGVSPAFERPDSLVRPQHFRINLRWQLPSFNENTPLFLAEIQLQQSYEGMLQEAFEYLYDQSCEHIDNFIQQRQLNWGERKISCDIKGNRVEQYFDEYESNLNPHIRTGDNPYTFNNILSWNFEPDPESLERIQNVFNRLYGRTESPAYQKAVALLEPYLNPEQLKDWQEHKHFTVVGNVTGHSYKIKHLAQINVECYTNDGTYKGKYCTVPKEHTPIPDQMLAQYFMLTTMEDEFLKVAIPWP